MGWQDRHYYRDSGYGAGNPLMWLLHGTVPLFTAFGIRVKAHATLIVSAAIILLLGFGGSNFVWQDRVFAVTMLFLIVLLHEFGHCFTARWVGGDANEIIMHPLGGLALAHAPRRPLPTFLTIAGGPAVNVLICIVFGTFLWLTSGWLPWNPMLTAPIRQYGGWLDLWRWSFWIYQTSYGLLIFNVLPIYPLDGGQMLQAILWPRFGYYKSMNWVCIAGIITCGFGIMIAIASRNIGLGILAFLGLMSCWYMRQQLLAIGPEEYSDDTDYSAAYEQPVTPRRRRPSRFAIRRARKIARQDEMEQQKIDAILAKVSAQGMQSLTWMEKRTLRKATERQRQRDLELSRSPRG